MIPEEGQIKSDTVVMVEAVAKGMAATGNPYAVPALAGSTLFAIIAGAYTNMRKKQKLADADDKALQAAIVTESVVKAIEEAAKVKVGKKGDTVGSLLKAKVEKNLRDNDAYLMGKAIIEAMKESR
jgi:primosomal protein N'